MSKKLITACLALVALAAFALPASASAAIEVTHPTGTRLATGTKITATNVGETIFKNDPPTEPLIKCTSAVMTGTLEKNNGTAVEGTIETARFSGTGPEVSGVHECTKEGGNVRVTTNGNNVDGENVTNGTPWCVRATSTMATKEFQVRGGACSQAERPLTFILDTTSIFGTIQCKYTRSTPIKGNYTADNNGGTSDAIMHLAAGENTTFTVEENPFGICPSTGTLEMSFTLETDTPTAEPLYLDH